MQQQSPQMFSIPPSLPTTNITTEQIQKYLDENKRLILAILENQNLGKLAECAQYQDVLQKNLMYLAAIADAQPQAPTAPHQMSPQTAIQPQGPFVQHPQSVMAQQLQQQSAAFGPRLPFQINALQPHDQQQHQQLLHFQQQQQQQQPMAGLMGMRISANNNNKQTAVQTGFGAVSSFMDSHGRRDGSEAVSGDAQMPSSGLGNSK
ncbi:hypothetical protein Nepgr_020153 [Nepenthes gracilis]|uniref:SS18 N-terminal domain-containing protein n=1 Tax=Nepenthes gracilis TaxID=150966 RepID=A0AAD3XUR9_NEPGR|nr:hypothetical protein Nepgr_020153 [Nepenthes gracilis]